MHFVDSSKQLPTKVSRPEYHRIRVMKPGDPPKYLYSSVSNARFDLIHLSCSRTSAEYYLHTPGSLFGYDFDEQLIVMMEEGKWFAFYLGRKFEYEQFSILGGNKNHGKI